MFHGPYTSGFGWDDNNYCVTADPSVWNEYLKSHKNVVLFKNKPFPFYKRLANIFGKDRASGTHVVGFGEAEEEIRDEENSHSENQAEQSDNGLGHDGVTSSTPCEASPGIETSSGAATKKKNRKRKRLDSTDGLIVDIMEKSSQNLGDDIKVASERLSLAIEDAKMKELKSKINGELRKLTGSSTMNRHKASIKIGCDGDLTMQSFTVPDEEKEEWIEALLTMG